MKKVFYGGHLDFCANLISDCSFRMAVPILRKFGTANHYKMTKRKEKKNCGHLVFCANLISTVALEPLYRSSSKLVQQFIIK